ncbi:hypothetical protein C8F01DRAFT_1083341 [Mycena amicta]|nr:hypothetical protein C8F01DRAFT_1083341 [Mycena amicta]
MGRTALHLTQADQKRAARERVVKYNNSERGHAARSAQRRQRHARKVTGSVLGNVSLVPALLRQHASFELPVDDPGFLDGYSPDYNSLDGRFSPWARFPVFPPPPPDVDIHPDSAEYHEETRLIEAVLHGDYRKQEQVYELELGQEADMAPKLRLQWLREEYEGALQSWRFLAVVVGQTQVRAGKHHFHATSWLEGEEGPAPLPWHCSAGRISVTSAHGFDQHTSARQGSDPASSHNDSRSAGSLCSLPREEQGAAASQSPGADGKTAANHRGQTLCRGNTSSGARAVSRLQNTLYTTIRAGRVVGSAKTSAGFGKEQIEGDEALRLWHEAWAEQQQVKQRRREAAQALLCVSRS